MDHRPNHVINPGDDGQPYIREEPIRVTLNPEQSDLYIPRKKKYPRNLPATFNGQLIRWISCFGLLRRDSGRFEGFLPHSPYEIEFDAAIINGETEFLVYFTGEVVRRLDVIFEGDIARATIPDGDPPIGISTG